MLSALFLYLSGTVDTRDGGSGLLLWSTYLMVARLCGMSSFAIGGIAIYDVTFPWKPIFRNYVNCRDFTGDAAAGTAGDLGPEGLLFIPANESPTGDPLLVVTNEVSGTTSILRVDGR